MRSWVLFLGLVASACSQDPAVPKLRSEIILRLAHSRDTIRAGEADTITVTATNNFGDRVSIRFPNACPVFAYIRDPRGNIVVPANGWTCLPVATTIALAKDESRDFIFVWTGRSEFAGGVQPQPLPPGEYYGTATMQAGSFVVHSPPVRVILAP